MATLTDVTCCTPAPPNAGEPDGVTEPFNLQYDPGEKYNQAADHPEIVGQLRKRMKELADDVGVGDEGVGAYFKKTA